MIPKADLHKRYALLSEVIEEVGEYYLRNFREPNEREEDPIGVLRNRIRSLFPDDALYDVKRHLKKGESGVTWLLQLNRNNLVYRRRLPYWSISGAILDTYTPRVGIVHAPALGDLFSGVRDEHAFLNGTEMSVSRKASLQESVLFAPGLLREHGLIEKFANATEHFYSLGVAALEISYVAAGFVDAYLSAETNIYQLAAPLLILKEAGGVIVDWNGHEVPIIPGYRSSIIAGNRDIVEECLRLCENSNRS